MLSPGELKGLVQMIWISLASNACHLSLSAGLRDDGSDSAPFWYMNIVVTPLIGQRDIHIIP